MSEWKAKRFWKVAEVDEADEGYRVSLDGRTLNTPGKLPLVLPNRVMAEAIAVEWNAQDEMIKPLTMPVTRSANSAIERVIPQKAEVAAMLAAYGETDLLCYRADGPAELTLRQAQGWDPLLDWAETQLGARLLVGAGILPVAQSEGAVTTLARIVAETEPFALTALHDLITLTGSLILGLAVSEGRLSANEAWDLSRIDEDWQTSQWGEDTEATEAARAKQAQLLHAERFLDLSRTK